MVSSCKNEFVMIPMIHFIKTNHLSDIAAVFIMELLLIMLLGFEKIILPGVFERENQTKTL